MPPNAKANNIPMDLLIGFRIVSGFIMSTLGLFGNNSQGVAG
jgi:hypothetical protein